MNRKFLSCLLALVIFSGCFLSIPVNTEAATIETVTINSVNDWMDKLSGKTATNMNIIVTADVLDFEGQNVEPVKSFSGVFDGRGVVIKNLTMVSSTKTGGEAGLFGCLGGDATFKNFVITDSSFKADQWVGAVCCCGGGDVVAENIYITETVTITAGVKNKNSYAGGLFGGFAGSVDECKISNCVFAGTITAKGKYNGGLVGALHNCPKLTVENSMVLGAVVNDTTTTANKDNSCGFVGGAKDGNITLVNCIYAGGPENEYYYNRPFFYDTARVSVTNCYTVATNSNGKVYNDVRYYDSNSGVTVFSSVDELYGEDASITVDGFIKQADGIMLPEGIYSMIAYDYTLRMLYGASVRFSDPSGLRFTAELNDKYLKQIKQKESGKTVSFGIMIAPTDYVNEVGGEFTAEALGQLDYEKSYSLVPAENILEGGEEEGYYVFTAVLGDLRKENHDRYFSARAYILAEDSDGDRTFYYSDYDPSLNSRSISYVSQMAFYDASEVMTDYYCYEIKSGTGIYSPYPTERREMLPMFYRDTDITFELAPEQVGISSSDITAVLEGFKANGLSMHSFAVMKGGVIIAEGYAEPFDENSLHRMYSVSKSFVSMAVGLLVQEGKISLDDTIDIYFPEYVTEDTDPRIAKAKIVDLLKMASPFDKVASCGDGQEDWIAAFFEGLEEKYANKMKEPGTTFYYDTGATHILSTIVERETGMPFLEYLKEKALLEIGFSEDSWCVKAPDPAGYSWGGSGVMCTTRDLALFANLVMNKGEYNGKQLLPADYVEAATSYQISTKEAEGDSDYYGYGYGYQIWMNPYGFAFMGMGSQHAYCIPEKDLVIVCTADNQGNSDAAGIIYSLFERHIIKKMSDEPIKDDPIAYEKMLDSLADMEIPFQTGALTSSQISSIDGYTYIARSGNAYIESFRFDFEGDKGTLTYNTSAGTKALRFGIGKNVECILDEPQYSGDTIGEPNGVGYRCLCSGAWKNGTTFVLKVQVIDDYFGNMTLTFDLDSSPSLTGTKTAEWFLDEYKMSDVSYRKY